MHLVVVKVYMMLHGDIHSVQKHITKMDHMVVLICLWQQEILLVISLKKHKNVVKNHQY